MPGEIIAEGEVRVGINLADFDEQLHTLTGDVDRALAELARKKASIEVELDIAPLEAEADAVDKQLAIMSKRIVTPRVDLDTKLFYQKAAKVMSTLEILNSRQLAIKADTRGIAKAEAEILALRALAAKSIKLDVEVDEHMSAAALGAVAAQTAAAGAGGGRSPGGGGSAGGAGAGVLSALLLGHAGGGGGGHGGRFLPWGLRALTGFGVGAGVGSIGSFAGFGAEHIVLTLGGIAGSGVAALGGGALVGAGALGTMAVGGGSDIGVMKSTAGDAKTLAESLRNVRKAQAVYGKGSKEAVEATKEFRFQVKELSAGTNGEGVKAELHMAHELEKVDELFDRTTQKARVLASHLFERGGQVAKHFVPKVAEAAEQNLPIVASGLAPLEKFLEGAEGNRIWGKLEETFKTNLPTAMHAFDQAMQFVLKTVADASQYTGGFVEALDHLFTKWNSPSGFRSWEGEIGRLVGTFKVWVNFFKTLGEVIFNLFSQDSHTGKSIVETITAMLKKVDEWEKSTSGASSIHNLFQVHKEEVLALLKLLPPLISSFKDIYMTVAPPLVEAVTSVLTVVAKLLNAFEKTGPLARWAVGLTVIAAKLRLLVPLLTAVGVLTGKDATTGAAAAAAGSADVAAEGGAVGVGATAAGTGAAAEAGLLRRYGAKGLGALGADDTGAALLKGGLGSAAGVAAGAVIPVVIMGIGTAAAAHALDNRTPAGSPLKGLLGPRTTHGGSPLDSIGNEFNQLFGGSSGKPVSEKQIKREERSLNEADKYRGNMQHILASVNTDWVQGLDKLIVDQEEAQKEINKRFREGGPSWKKETRKSIMDVVDSIREGMKLGIIPVEQGKAEIKSLLSELKFKTGEDPLGIAKNLKEELTKGGKITGEGIQHLLDKLSELPPKSRGIVRTTIVEMLKEWAAGKPKQEAIVKALTHNMDNYFTKSKDNIIKGAGEANEKVGLAFGQLLSHVHDDLGGVINSTIGALKSLGVKTVSGAEHVGSGILQAGENIVNAIIPGHNSGHHATGARVNRPTFFAGEEAPQHPEWVIASNPAYRGNNIGYWAEAGHALGIPGFAKGGISHPHLAGTPALAAVGNASIQDVYAAAEHFLERAEAKSKQNTAGPLSGGVTASALQFAKYMLEVGFPHSQKLIAEGLGTIKSESGYRKNNAQGASGHIGPWSESPTFGSVAVREDPLGSTRAAYKVGWLPTRSFWQAWGQWEAAQSGLHGGGAGTYGPEFMGIAGQALRGTASSGGSVRHRLFRGGRIPGYKGGGKVQAGTDDQVLAWGKARVGEGENKVDWGFKNPGEWCGDFVAADLSAHGLGPFKFNYHEASEWKNYGEPRTDADRGDVVVYPNHVGFSLGGGQLLSGNYDHKVSISQIHGDSSIGEPIAVRRPPYGEGGSSTSGGSASAPSKAQKERAKIKAYEKKNLGHTAASGGTYGPGATKHEIAKMPLSPLHNSPLPAWAHTLPKNQREELEAPGETTEGRRGAISTAEGLSEHILSKSEGELSRARAKAEKNHEYNSATVEALRQRVKAAKEGQKGAYAAAYGFENGIIKYATKWIKKANWHLKKPLNKGERKKWLMVRAKWEGIRATARGERLNDKSVIEADELYGEAEGEEIGEITEERESGEAYLKETREAEETEAKETQEKAEAAAQVYSEDLTNANKARWELLSGYASNILNARTPQGMLHMYGEENNIFLKAARAFVTAAAPNPGTPLRPGSTPNTPAEPGPTVVNQNVVINTPEVNAHAVAQGLAFRAKVA